MKGSETIKINHLMFVHRGVNMFSCNVCQKTFIRGYNMRRHMKEQHRYGPEQECSSTPQPRVPAPTNAPPCVPLPQRQQTMIFQHLFTMSVSGPTSGGKTTFVKKLLLNNLIQPLPTRIIWLYRRWQPLYDDVKRAVYPPVEFIQHILVLLYSKPPQPKNAYKPGKPVPASVY